MYFLPPHKSPLLSVSPKGVIYLLYLMNLHWHVISPQIHSLQWGSLYIGVHSVGLDKCVCVRVRARARSVMSNSATPWIVACQPPLSMRLSHRDFGVYCYFLIQGVFPAQGLNLHLLWLLHWQADSLPLSRLGSQYWTSSLLYYPKGKEVENILHVCLDPESLTCPAYH